MQAILNEFAQLARIATGQPESLAEQITVGVAGALAFAVVLLVVGRAFQCAMSEPGRVMATLTILLLVAGMTAAVSRLGLVPMLDHAVACVWVPVGLTVLALAGIGVPAGCFLLKGSYGKTLTAVALALAAALAAMTLVRAGFGVFRAGDAGLAPARSRQEQGG